MSAQVAAALRAALEGWTEEQWTKGTYARDKNGKEVPSSDPSATRWCSVGWTYKVSDHPIGAWDLQDALEAALPDEEIPDWQDAPERTFSEVRSLWLRAAELAEKEGAGR